jgi:hypothetical protein
MPRLRRLHVAGASYLVEQRALGLFVSADDYRMFVDLLEKRARRSQVSVIGFCLLPDSFLLLVEVGTASVGSLVNSLEAAYSRVRARSGANRRFARRPRVLLVDLHSHLVTMLRYLHWLPVRAGLCFDPDDYLWTSHSAYMGRVNLPWVLRPVRLLRHGHNAYRRFMRRPLDEQEVTQVEGPGEVDPRVLGGRSFLATLPVRTHYRTVQGFGDVARSVALVLGVEVTEIASARRAHRLSLARAIVTWQCVHRHALTLGQCAILLNRNPRTLLRAIARYKSIHPGYFTIEGIPDAAPILPLPSISLGGKRAH